MKLLAVTLAASLLSTAALAQGVEVAPLSAPDIFSGGSRETGLGDDLWKGSSAGIARMVLPTLGTRPLSPAARGLAVRVLSTGANAPDGAATDTGLAAARGRALLALGEAGAANAAVERIPNLGADPALAEVAAEAALITGADDRACRIGETLATGRGELYWLRLRAYCQAIGGQPDAAQLSLTLANEKGRDPVATRLLQALMLGGDAGPPSARNGLELALSRKLGLTPTAQDAAPAIARLLAPEAPPAPSAELMQTDPFRAAWLSVRAGDLAQARVIRDAVPEEGSSSPGAVDLFLLDASIAILGGEATEGRLEGLLSPLVTRAEVGGSKAASSAARTGAAYLAALGTPMRAETRASFYNAIGLAAPTGVGGRLTLLELAAEAGLKGETALLVLSLPSDTPADRATIIRALRKAGLTDDARAYAVEGLLALSPK